MFIGLKVANHLWHHGILPHITPIELGQEVERVEVFDEIFNLAGPSMILEKYIDDNLHELYLFGSMRLQGFLTKLALVLSKPLKAFQIFQGKTQRVSP